MQVLLRKWPGFMDGAAAQGDPVEEGRGVQVQELAEELLVHVEGRIHIAPDGELQAWIQHDVRIAHPQYRLHAYVEDCVISVALHNLQLVGQREGPTDVPFAKVTCDGQE